MFDNRTEVLAGAHADALRTRRDERGAAGTADGRDGLPALVPLGEDVTTSLSVALAILRDGDTQVVLYLNASALLKAVRREAESDALGDVLRQHRSRPNVRRPGVARWWCLQRTRNGILLGH